MMEGEREEETDLLRLLLRTRGKKRGLKWRSLTSMDDYNSWKKVGEGETKQMQIILKRSNFYKVRLVRTYLTLHPFLK